MKKVLMIILMAGLITPKIAAELRYNIVTNLYYSHPETSDINQVEYRLLVFACIEIENRIKAVNGVKNPPLGDYFKQCEIYLKRIGTPTALRLISDLKLNKMYYSDGSFMRKIWEQF